MVGSAVAVGFGTYYLQSSQQQGGLINPFSFFLESHNLTNERWTPLQLTKITPVSESASIFEFKLTKPMTIPICSAVYIKDDQIQAMRAYTPVHYSLKDQPVVQFLVKRYSEGQVSRFMHSARLGQKIEMRGPVMIWPASRQDLEAYDEIGMIAGGTGITAVLPVIHSVLTNGNKKTKLSLLFAAQSEDELYFKDELDQLAKSHSEQFKVSYTIDHLPDPSKASNRISVPAGQAKRTSAVIEEAQPWAGHVGYVKQGMLEGLLPMAKKEDTKKFIILVCGPESMVKHVAGGRGMTGQDPIRGVLGAMGFKKEQVFSIAMPYRKRVPEFQAVIMAGYGNGLYPLTEESNMPKALLPIVNQPMISYPLSWLEASGVSDVIVVSLNSGSKKLGHYLDRVYEGTLHITLEVVDDNTGTADALALIKDKIQTDFIVISCDLLTDLIPHQFLDMHRSEDPTVTALFFEPNKGEAGPSGSSKIKDVTQYVGIDASNSQLAYLNNSDSMDAEEFTLRMSLLKQHPVLNITRLLQDGHLYVFKRWVIDLISVVSQKRNMASIKEHVLPLLVKSQHQKVLADREGVTKVVEAAMAANPNTQKLALSLSTTQTSEEVSTEFEQNGEWKSPIKCKAFVVAKDVYCGRVNTIPNYFEINRYYTKITDKVRNPGATNQVQTQVGADSFIGDDTKIGDRSSVKKSTIGGHCTIGKNVKIVNTIVMDHAVIEDNVKLDGCILGSGSKVCEKSTLKDCEVGGGFRVEKETNSRNEQLVDFQEQ
ncbi:hypothetical protein BG004_004169 [Podila humilis]|nr:hypothetical protein BG004_004169 [Podila humilis]